CEQHIDQRGGKRTTRNAQRPMAQMQAAAVVRWALCVLSLISQRSYGVQARRRPGRCESGNESGQHRHDHAREDESDRELNRKRWKCLPNSNTHHVCKCETDKSTEEA